MFPAARLLDGTGNIFPQFPRLVQRICPGIVPFCPFWKRKYFYTAPMFPAACLPDGTGNIFPWFPCLVQRICPGIMPF
jgi:hypothetical protein